MIELSDEERNAVMRGKAVCIKPSDIGKNVVLLLEEQYEKLQELAEEERADRKVQDGWQKLALRGLALSRE